MDSYVVPMLWLGLKVQPKGAAKGPAKDLDGGIATRPKDQMDVRLILGQRIGTRTLGGQALPTPAEIDGQNRKVRCQCGDPPSGGPIRIKASPYGSHASHSPWVCNPDALVVKSLTS